MSFRTVGRKYNLPIQKHWLPTFLFIAAFAVYFFTRGIGLDDWDSVQFAMGTRQFDLWQHQPHPPGYPLFILLARVLNGIFHFGPEFSLHLISCLGGALFVTAWFLIARAHFDEVLALLLAISLVVTAIVWMTATRAVSDAIAAGLISVELYQTLRHRETGRYGALARAALFGAAAVGIRPQLVLIAAIILATNLGGRARTKLLGLGLFSGACLIWLSPMWYLQWRLRPEFPLWQVYPKLLFDQWTWRLDNPLAYIGAGDWSYSYLADRFASHILGWFTLGLGISRWSWSLIIGAGVMAAGIAIYLTKFQNRDRQFWKTNAPWASVHVTSIFCFAPWEQRYYLPIFPLLLVSIVSGYLRLPKLWKLLGLGLPILLLVISVPLAIQNHTEPGPAIRLVLFLEDRYPPRERNKVVLFLGVTRRTAEWYAPQFHLLSSTQAGMDPGLVEDAAAVYTDDPTIELPPGWRLTFIASFSRPDLISPKQNPIDLYGVERE